MFPKMLHRGLKIFMRHVFFKKKLSIILWTKCICQSSDGSYIRQNETQKKDHHYGSNSVYKFDKA
jgi:hypothetical protein